jgi:hypothetical protein
MSKIITAKQIERRIIDLHQNRELVKLNHYLAKEYISKEDLYKIIKKFEKEELINVLILKRELERGLKMGEEVIIYNIKRRLNIYHVEQDLYNGYDTYSDFVIICETEEEARNTSPDGYELKETKSENRYGCWVSKEEVDKVKVTLIGRTTEDAIKGIVCNSFHAG